MKSCSPKHTWENACITMKKNDILTHLRWTWKILRTKTNAPCSQDETTRFRSWNSCGNFCSDLSLVVRCFECCERLRYNHWFFGYLQILSTFCVMSEKCKHLTNIFWKMCLSCTACKSTNLSLFHLKNKNRFSVVKDGIDH